MQFYIIHEDPKINTKMMPDYGIRINVHEGYQMLSDIGHLFNVTWEGQHKKYNPYHAETRQYCKNIMWFDFFISHYERCLIEYELRFWSQTKFHEGYEKLKEKNMYQLRENISTYSNNYYQVIKYLLERKRNKLNEKEIKVLEGII